MLGPLTFGRGDELPRDESSSMRMNDQLSTPTLGQGAKIPIMVIILSLDLIVNSLSQIYNPRYLDATW